MIKLNCGFSRKVGEANYGSRGASVNVELELATDAARDGDGLHEKIRRLFALARKAVDEELASPAPAGEAEPAPASPQTPAASRPSGSANGSAPASNKQTKLIMDLGQQRRMSLSQVQAFCHEVAGVADVYRLTRSQASAVIDQLKHDNPSPAGRR